MLSYFDASSSMSGALFRLESVPKELSGVEAFFTASGFVYLTILGVECVEGYTVGTCDTYLLAGSLNVMFLSFFTLSSIVSDVSS